MLSPTLLAIVRSGGACASRGSGSFPVIEPCRNPGTGPSRIDSNVVLPAPFGPSRPKLRAQGRAADNAQAIVRSGDRRKHRAVDSG